nr:translation initiation factor IF-3 [Sediminihabitans luteus]
MRVPEVRLIGPGGEQVGVVRTEVALSLAQDADLDLVEVAPDARPPVCKLMDFGKFKYESDMKAREARRNQANTILKEIRFRLKIDPHDYGTKKGHVERFLKAGDKVKVMIMFRGREQSRPEMGVRLLQRLAEDVAEIGFVESMPKQDGRNMTMVIGPVKKKAEAKVEQRKKQEESAPVPEAAAPVRGSRREQAAAAKAAERSTRPAPAAPEAPAFEVPSAEELAAPVAAPEPAAAPAASAPAPAASKPAASRPAASRPAASRPAASKPAASKPASARPAAAKPAAASESSAAAEKPAAAKPAATPKPVAKPKPVPAPKPAARPAAKPTPRGKAT